MKMRVLYIFLSLLLAVQGTLAAPLAAGRKAPQFTVIDQTSKPLTLSKYSGKVVLLNFWASWCAPCRVEMPWFEEFSNVYKDRGLVVIGIAMDDEGWKTARPQLQKLKISYPVGLKSRSVGRDYGVTQSLPVTFLIDRDGIVRTVKEGFGSKEEFSNMLQTVLGKH